MAKRGPKGLSPEQKRARGTDQPCRKVIALFPDLSSRPDPADIPPAPWLSRDAKAIWAEKVDRYRQRGQKIDGFQEALAHYCALEATIRALYRRKITPTMAMIGQFRTWAAEFYDTPTSQKITPGGGRRGGNAFNNNGRKPEA